jgi:hypothetical protein
LTDDEILSLCGKAKNASKFNALMSGDTSQHDGDDSKADLALLCILTFYSRDAVQLERLFGQSRLGDRDKWRDRADYRKLCIDKALALVTEQYRPPRRKRRAKSGGQAESPEKESSDKDAPPQSFTLATLTLIPGLARRTPSGKINVQVGVVKGDEVLVEFPITSVASSWKNPARQLLQLLADEPGELPKVEEIERLFMKIIAEAIKRADAPEVREGPTVAEVVRAKAPLQWQLASRTDKGAWSEAKPGELSRTEFINGVTEELMTECAGASDAPRMMNGRPARYDLLHMIQDELGITWATILATLPTRRDADLGVNTAAGRLFRSEMVKLWTVPGTWEIPKNAEGVASEHIGATKASLISRVQSKKRRWEQSGSNLDSRDRWSRIHPALSAWWRVGEAEGEIKVFLAMRWELANQVRQELTAVSDQESLTRLGKQFGVLSDKPVVPDRTTGSRQGERQERLAVLSDDITEELMALPVEVAEEQAAG